MEIPDMMHRWDVTAGEAVRIQRELAARVRMEKPGKPFRLVVGLDCAFPRAGGMCLACAVVWDVKKQEVLETALAASPLTFPYVPGLLSFREVPALLEVLRKLHREPEVLMCDGQGLAHPRRFGLACHLGVLTDRPALGCAKSRLCGEHREPARERGSFAALVHAGAVVGSVLRTRDGVRPLYVSAGHRLDLPSARRLVLACAIRYRLPEPTRRADQRVNAAARTWVPG